MLIQLSIKNFKSFKDRVTLSLSASGYDKEIREDENVFAAKQPTSLRILKSAVVYGANASGKTKLIEAMTFMKRWVKNSDNEDNKTWLRNFEPFLLNKETENSPIEFEVVFTHENIRYRYGFEVTPSLVISEWLYYTVREKEIEVFYREGNNLESHPRLPDFKQGKMVAKADMVKPHVLWLSAATKWNDTIANKVTDWFDQVHILSGINAKGYMGFTLSQLAEKGDLAREINNIVKAASTGMEEVVVRKLSLDDIPNEIRDEIAERMNGEDEGLLIQDTARYPQFDKSGNRVGSVDFDIDSHESSGTRKFLALTGPILDVLIDGSILFVDEIDAQLHPNLVCKLVGLFNSKKYNPKGAQLVFNTHDTNLLSSGLFRRDQIWFVEKDRYGSSDLYPLTDYSPRKGENLESNYIQGKYGAVPYLGDFDRLMQM